MTDLTPGVSVYGTDTPPSQFDQDWTVFTNINALAYIPDTPEVGVNFTAPTSGRVLVCVGCGVRNNAANADRAIVTFGLYEDSANGTLIVAPTAYSGVITQGLAVSSDYRYACAYVLEQNLEPGRSYYARVFYQSILGSATVDIGSRNISVIPMP